MRDSVAFFLLGMQKVRGSNPRSSIAKEAFQDAKERPFLFGHFKPFFDSPRIILETFWRQILT